jgi:hypothetical protein
VGRSAAVALGLASAVGFAAAATAADVPGRVVDLASRPGLTQRILLLEPDQPVASVVLLPGGHGNLDVQPDGRTPHGVSR